MNWLFNNQDKTEYEFILSKLGKKMCSIGFKDIFVVNAQDLFECKLEPYWGQRAVAPPRRNRHRPLGLSPSTRRRAGSGCQGSES